MNKKVLFLILLVSVFPVLAFAQAPTLASMAQGAMNTILTAVGFIVVIFWIVTGILFLSAMGDPLKLNTAKMALLTAVIGTILVIIAYYATDFVGHIFNI